MSTLVAHRVRHASIRIGSITAMLTFVILGGGDLFVQWIAGYASPAFMLGTLLIRAVPEKAESGIPTRWRI